jgi:hypothetical protein
LQNVPPPQEFFLTARMQPDLFLLLSRQCRCTRLVPGPWPGSNQLPSGRLHLAAAYDWVLGWVCLFVSVF